MVYYAAEKAHCHRGRLLSQRGVLGVTVQSCLDRYYVSQQNVAQSITLPLPAGLLSIEYLIAISFLGTHTPGN